MLELNKEFRKLQDRWQALAETAPDYIVSIDSEGKILFLNRPITTSTIEEVIGKPATDFVFPEQRATLKNALAKVFKEGVPTEYEILARDNKKNPAWYHTRVAPVIIDGKVVSATLITRDITERKIMEEELKSARTFLEQKVAERTTELQKTISTLEATIESTADGIMVMDLDRKIIRFNKKFLNMWPVDEIYKKSGDGYLALKQASDLTINPKELLELTEFIYAHPDLKSANTLKLKDGRTVERYSQPQILNGKIIGRVWSFRDVTAQIRAEEERDSLLEKEQQARLDAEKLIRARDEFYYQKLKTYYNL